MLLSEKRNNNISFKRRIHDLTDVEVKLLTNQLVNRLKQAHKLKKGDLYKVLVVEDNWKDFQDFPVVIESLTKLDGVIFDLTVISTYNEFFKNYNLLYSNYDFLIFDGNTDEDIKGSDIVDRFPNAFLWSADAMLKERDVNRSNSFHKTELNKIVLKILRIVSGRENYPKTNIFNNFVPRQTEKIA